MRILVVDDVFVQRKRLVEFFNDTKHEIVDVGAYEDAILKAKSENYDIAIIDIDLKYVKTGIDLITDLKKIQPKLYVIMCSGNLDRLTLNSAALAGAHDFISKPIDETRLLFALEKAQLEWSKCDKC